MNSEDRDLKPADIQLLSNPDAIAAFFTSLGYDTGMRVKQSASALGITPDAIARTIKHVERIADQENGSLQVYLFELSSVTQAGISAISRSLKNRQGKFLLVITSDYEKIDFVLLERVLPLTADGGFAAKGVSIRPRTLTVNRRKPDDDKVAMRVLRRFSYTELDADYQYDKLLSAYGVAEWSEPHFNNRALFSDYYLLERLPQTAEWSEEAKTQFLKCRELFTTVRERLGGQKEAVVREKLFEPLFDLLGFKFKAGKSADNSEAEPDYRLYAKDASVSDKPIAVCLTYTWNRYLDGRDETRDTETSDENPGAHVVTLLEAGDAPWAIVTNGKLWRLYSAKTHSRATNYYEIDLEETLALADPQEAFRYFWLFFRASAFEAKESLLRGEKRRVSFLEKLMEDSEAYAKELGEKLKSRVFEEIFSHFATGFIENMGGAEYMLSLPEDERDEKLNDCFQGTLTFLYRLLFLLYSESRNLLPVIEARGYWETSLERLKGEVSGHAGRTVDEAHDKLKKAYSAGSTELYDRLFKLFGIIDGGNADVNVPLYNGGLFITTPARDDATLEARNARFLSTCKIPDRYLAVGLDRMARDIDNKTHGLVPIDYKSLGVRHLGSIYEGLLEFKLHVATEKMAVVKGKKTEEIVAYKEAKKNGLKILTVGRGQNAEERILKKGTVYLENDKRERKATGSYYTPDYIVKYIVENTVGPVLAEKLDAMRPRLREAQLTLKKERDKYKAMGSKGDSPENQTYLKHRHLVDELFDIKVLDPAMGSGHFLVEAVDFISDKILGDKEGFLRAFPYNPITAELERTRQTIVAEMERQNVSIDRNRLTDVNLLKRHILKRCIYGVDLNPMAVELAKVSLWLDCFTLGAPLSFLDHHLKCGNSLIGAKVKDARDAVETGQMSLLGGSHFQGLMLATDLMRHIGEMSDVTAEQVKSSRTEYRRAVDALAPFKRYMDVYVSQWFGNEPRVAGKGKARKEFNTALEFLRTRDAEDWAKAPDKVKLPAEWKSVAATALGASQDKRFFHWELEFPEVFFGAREGTTQVIEEKDGAGFDTVVGNPPYVRHEQNILKEYFANTYETYSGRADIYVYFLEMETGLIKPSGYVGVIVSNKFTEVDYGQRLKEYLTSNSLPMIMVNFADLPIFDDVTAYPMIVVLKNSKDRENHRIKMAKPKTLDNFPEGLSFESIPIGLFKWKSLNSIIEKLSDFSTTLSNYSGSPLVGIKTGSNDSYIYDNPKEDTDTGIIRPYLFGRNVGRYHINEPVPNVVFPYKREQDKYVSIKPKGLGKHYAFLKLNEATLKARAIICDKHPKGQCEWYDYQQINHSIDYDLPKIVFPNISDKPSFTIDNGCLTDMTAFVIPSSDVFLLALLNSQLLFYVIYSAAVKRRGDFLEWKVQYVEKLPIRRINFTTPLPARNSLLAELTAAYSTGAHDSVISKVDSLLPRDEQGIFKAFCPGATGAEEKSDVVHDFLAYLAEHMIEMNKERHVEEKRLLTWLIGKLNIQPDNNGNTGIDALTGKSKLKNYLGDYQKGEAPLPFDDLMEILHKNQARLGVRLTSDLLSSGGIAGKIRDEYEKSLAKLLPIKERLAYTDKLIDQVVYKLYGLTEEEIAIVEGNAKGK